ncbi:MAG: twin-arginine translocation pathway signal protein [Rubritepida sp.]|nr:twin-arginine translocation pathway signal protein [Rubritepida sp.]
MLRRRDGTGAGPAARPAGARAVGVEFGLPDTVAYGWQGLSVAARLCATLNDAIQNPDATRRFRDTGAEPVLHNPAQMAGFVRRGNAVWRPLLREPGIRLDG